MSSRSHALKITQRALYVIVVAVLVFATRVLTVAKPPCDIAISHARYSTNVIGLCAISLLFAYAINKLGLTGNKREPALPPWREFLAGTWALVSTLVGWSVGMYAMFRVVGGGSSHSHSPFRNAFALGLLALVAASLAFACAYLVPAVYRMRPGNQRRAN